LALAVLVAAGFAAVLAVVFAAGFAAGLAAVLAAGLAVFFAPVAVCAGAFPLGSNASRATVAASRTIGNLRVRFIVPVLPCLRPRLQKIFAGVLVDAL
jgi:hypothetical protein